MKINNYDNRTNFGIKLKTVHVLETTSGVIFDSVGTDGFKAVITALDSKPRKGIGNRGYRYYAQMYGEQICAKYPKIAEVSAKIREIKASNPMISKQDLIDKIKPDMDKLGSQIDINL